MEDITDDPIPVNDSFPDEQLVVVKVQSHSDPWFVDYANFIVAKFLPPGFTFQQRKKFFTDLRHYFWDDPHLYKEGADRIVRRCIPEHDQEDILRQCHDSPYGIHHAGERTALEDKFYEIQAQIYDLQNQNCEYELKFLHMGLATECRILETKMSFETGKPLPWKLFAKENMINKNKDEE